MKARHNVYKEDYPAERKKMAACYSTRNFAEGSLTRRKGCR